MEDAAAAPALPPAPAARPAGGCAGRPHQG